MSANRACQDHMAGTDQVRACVQKLDREKRRLDLNIEEEKERKR